MAKEYPVDIEELQKLVKEQTAQLEKYKKLEEDSTSEIERMREHQKSLLEETKAAKEARREALDKVNSLSTKMEEFEKNGLIHEGNYKELLDKQTEKLKLNYETSLSEQKKQLEDVSSKLTGLQEKYAKEKINGVLRTAAEKANVIPSAIDDVLFRASGVFAIGEDGTIEARDKDGNLRKVGTKQLTPETFVDSLKESASHLWPPSAGAGANGNGNAGSTKTNPWAKDTFNRTEQAKIMNTNPDLGNQLMEEAKAS